MSDPYVLVAADVYPDKQNPDARSLMTVKW